MKLFFATEPVPLKSMIVFPHGKKTKKNPKTLNDLWTSAFIGLHWALPRDSSCSECPVVQRTPEPTLASTRRRWLLVWPPWAELLEPHCANYNKHSRSQSPGPSAFSRQFTLTKQKKKTKKKGLGTKRTRLTMNNEIFIVFLSSKTFRESAGRFWSLWFLNGVETGAINGYRGG